MSIFNDDKEVLGIYNQYRQDTILYEKLKKQQMEAIADSININKIDPKLFEPGNMIPFVMFIRDQMSTFCTPIGLTEAKVIAEYMVEGRKVRSRPF